MIRVINTHCSAFAIPATERPDCILGAENSEAISPSAVSGQYLDRDRPLACSQGHLTTWHYCFYTSTVSESGSYQASFRVWRPTTQADAYTLVHSYSLSVTIDHATVRTNTTLTCDIEVLEANEYVPVIQGDILGVYIPEVAPLNVTYMGRSTSGVYHDTRGEQSAETEKSVSLRSLRRRGGLGIHLYADIGM